MMVYVTDTGEGRGQDTQPVVERPPTDNVAPQARSGCGHGEEQ